MEEVLRDERIGSFHDLRLLTHQDHLVAAFNIVLELEMPGDQSASVERLLKNRLAGRLSDVGIAIKVESFHA